MDLGVLDQAFEYTKTSSRFGGLLVARRGYLVYEKYFGESLARGDSEHGFLRQNVYQHVPWDAAASDCESLPGRSWPRRRLRPNTFPRRRSR